MSTRDILTRKADAPDEAQFPVDYVLVLDVKASSKADYAAIEAEYRKITSALTQTGLSHTSRPGNEGELLIFIHAKDGRFKAELHAQGVNDWLMGITSAKRPDPRQVRDFAESPVTSAERLRIVYDLITGLPDVTKDQLGSGAGITVASEAFPRVKGIFPPHDQNFNREWLTTWTTSASAFAIPEEQLNRVKNHFGENIALYFEFLRLYFAALSLPAGLGFLFWWLDFTYSPVYSILLVAWSLLFVEGWRYREEILAVRWGTKNANAMGRRRAQFKGDRLTEDSVTGRRKRAQIWWKKESRILSTIPIIVAFGAGLSLLITSIFFTEVMINEVYSGKGKQYLSLLPTVLFAGLVPRVVAAWQRVARRLTDYEDHEHEATYDKSLTLKTFCLSAIPAFGNLTLTAYVYIPFGRLIVPRLLHFFHTQDQGAYTVSSLVDNFSINPSRLTNTVFALTTTGQIIGAVTETIVPLISRFASSKVSNGSSETSFTKTDKPEEAKFLDRIRKESALPQYELFGDYAELVQQFGYVCLWSVVWPLVPLAALINNFIEMRSDAFKMCVNARRPVPRRAETIGPWLETLGFMTWLAAFVNSSLIYMFKPRAVSQRSLLVDKFAHVVNNTLPINVISNNTFHSTPIYQAAAVSTDTFASIRATMFTALLVGLASEHAYLLARWATRHVLREVLWRHSAEEVELRNANFVMKRQYLDAMRLEVPQVDTNSLAQEDSDEAFYGGGDQGLAEIQRLHKAQ